MIHGSVVSILMFLFQPNFKIFTCSMMASFILKIDYNGLISPQRDIYSIHVSLLHHDC